MCSENEISCSLSAEEVYSGFLFYPFAGKKNDGKSLKGRAVMGSAAGDGIEGLVLIDGYDPYCGDGRGAFRKNDVSSCSCAISQPWSLAPDLASSFT